MHFLELTKHGYSRHFPAVVAIPRTYIAKKVSERAQGVGRITDLVILFFNNPQGAEFLPTIQILSVPEFTQKLDDTYNALMTNEKAQTR